MRYLWYTNYQAGHSGLSNGIMSIEVGVVLAHLTNRLLVLEGNIPPPANLVAYDGRVSNERPSRVTDLIDVPVPWVEPDSVDLSGLESLELTNLSLGDFAFYFPKTLDLSTEDARSFARNRDHWVTVTGEHDPIEVLRLSETPFVPGTKDRRRNLGYYSYQFYLDNETRRSVYRLLQGMQAKQPFAQLATRVARDLGQFNAVHMRRGDFKVTYGVTTLDRKPFEAIEAMEQLFDRKDSLVIVTDERDDPFFQEIKLAFPKHVFIDWHILDNYRAQFEQLPQKDSLSLAYLSQLVAAESKEFLGTMTSTFTALIQRYRGNRGKDEVFRYLWNELPDGGQGLERGRHAISECIPLERGEMIEQFPGRYSWNRVSQLLNPAWMREWPESFVTPARVATGALFPEAPGASAGSSPREVSTSIDLRSTRPMEAPPFSLQAATSANQPVLYVSFENLQVAVWSKDAILLQQLAPELGGHLHTEARNVIRNFAISGTRDQFRVEQTGREEATACDRAHLPAVLKRQIAGTFMQARYGYAWLSAAAYAKKGRGLAVVGEIGDAKDTFRKAMYTDGWELVEKGLFAIRVEDLTIVPLGARTQPEGAALRAGRWAAPLEGVVILERAPLHASDAALMPLSPAAAVVKLIAASLDFPLGHDRAVSLLCKLAEARSAAQVRWSQPQDAARVIAAWAEQRDKAVA
ncbi:MAG TPA: O-fucosyltransferase family protein [Polyangia bacterium]